MKRILHHLARNQMLWRYLWSPLAHLSRHMSWQRSQAELERLRRELGPEYRVQSGPFKGMRYPRFEAVGSSLIAKLLGTYEIEIEEVIERFVKKSFDTVIDVGCAEGYYAVGLAMRSKNTQVYAFDIDQRAREICSEMASLNGVAEHVKVQGLCTSENLLTLANGGRTLIISDCEGGELDLFNEATASGLKKCELLIEAHDFIVRGISQTLQRRFAPTHDCQLLHSLHPLDKGVRHPSPLIRETAPEVTSWLYNEGRPEPMEWLHFTPRLA